MKGKCRECPGYNDCPRMKGESYCLSSSHPEGVPADFAPNPAGIPGSPSITGIRKKKLQKNKENTLPSKKKSF